MYQRKNNRKQPKTATKNSHNQNLCLHGESLLNEWGRGVFILGHRHPIKENKSKEREFGRQSGRVVTGHTLNML